MPTELFKDKVEVSLDGRKIPQNKQMGADALTIITASERTPVISVFVQWDLKPMVTATPERVGWVDAANRELKASVVLKHADGKPFRVLAAKPTHPSLHVEGLSKASAVQHELQVVLSADTKPGTYNESITFTLDDPNQPELLLRVTAILR